MRFVYFQPGRASATSVILGLISIAIVVSLVVFMLPVVLGIFAVVVLAGLVFWLWSWIKMKMGWESEEVKTFREAMAQAEAAARSQYSGRAEDPDGTVYESERVEVRALRTDRTRRRGMEDVSDVEEVK